MVHARIVEGDLTDAKPVKYASRYAYQRFLDMGIEIYEVVDGTWSIFGSANFDNRSLELNDEINVAVSDPGLAARLRAGSAAGEDARRGRMAPPVAAREDPRALLELFRGDLLEAGG